MPRTQADVAVQSSLFAEEKERAVDNEISDAIRELDLEQLKPIDALNFLYAIREKISDKDG